MLAPTELWWLRLVPEHNSVRIPLSSITEVRTAPESLARRHALRASLMWAAVLVVYIPVVIRMALVGEPDGFFFAVWGIVVAIVLIMSAVNAVRALRTPIQGPATPAESRHPPDGVISATWIISSESWINRPRPHFSPSCVHSSRRSCSRSFWGIPRWRSACPSWRSARASRTRPYTARSSEEKPLDS